MTDRIVLQTKILMPIVKNNREYNVESVEYVLFFVLFMFILHSRKGKLYRHLLDWTSALAWELLFSRCLGSPQPFLNAERQAGKLWISFYKVFCYDSTRKLNS